MLRSAPEARQVAVEADGTLDLDDLDAALAAAERPLVAVQAVNNETGVIHPIAEIADRVKAAGGLLLVDCAQSAGKLPLPDADFVIVAAHKLGGPPGSRRPSGPGTARRWMRSAARKAASGRARRRCR